MITGRPTGARQIDEWREEVEPQKKSTGPYRVPYIRIPTRIANIYNIIIIIIIIIIISIIIIIIIVIIIIIIKI